MILKGCYQHVNTIKTGFRAFSVKHFRLPDLGEKIKEAVIKKWNVQVGDQVDEFDTVAEVATDKLFTELPSPHKGVVHKLYHKEGGVCMVGDILLDIETNSDHINKGKDLKDDKNANHRDLHSKLRSMRSVLAETDTLASPAVRLLAKRLNVDLKNIKSSRRSGRILKEDVYEYLYQLEHSHDSSSKIDQNNDVAAATQESIETSHEEIKPHRNFIEDTNDRKILQFNSLESEMVKNMTKAVKVPHFNLHDEADITQLEIICGNLSGSGKEFSLFSFVIKAFSEALYLHPKVNASYYAENHPYEYYLNSNHNISIAVESPMGITTPSIKNVGSLSIEEINEYIIELNRTAGEEKIDSEHLNGGTVSLFNMGVLSGSYYKPLNLPNQVCVASLGMAQLKPVYDDKLRTFNSRKILPISFGCDHRVLDGATVARFSLAWKTMLENPEILLMNLK